MSKIFSKASLCVLLSVPFAWTGGGLSAQPHHYRSQVLGTDGQPISGAIVTVKGGASAVTDKDGHFSIEGLSTPKSKTVTMWNRAVGSFTNETIEVTDTNGVVVIKAPGFYDKELPLNYFAKKSRRGYYTITLVPRTEKSYNGYVNTALSEAQSADEKNVSTQGIEQKDFSDKLTVGAAIGNNVAGLQVVVYLFSVQSFRHQPGRLSEPEEGAPVLILQEALVFGYGQSADVAVSGNDAGG